MFDKKTVIAIGCDHAGFAVKKHVVETLSAEGYEFKDFGTFSDSSVDYPDFAHQVASSVATGTHKVGLLVCGSGNGMAMSANKHRGVRCALCWTEEIAGLARQHNNANMMAMPGRYIAFEQAVKMVKRFLDTPFEGGRHQLRVEKIDL